MTAKRLLAFVLMTVMLLGTLTSLVACKPTGDSNSTTPSDTTTLDPVDDPNRELTLFEAGEWKFNIVRQAKLQDLDESASIAIRTKLTSSVSGVSRISFERDNEETKDADTLEVYMGYIDRAEMKAFYSSVGVAEGAIKVVGNKILVYANSYTAYEKLAKHLNEVCSANYNDEKIVVKASDLETTVVIDEVINTLPVPEGVYAYSYVDCDLKQTLVIFNDATPEKFNAYKAKFTDYTEVQTNEVQGNCFATYAKDGNLINISYAKDDSMLRVIVNKNTTPSKYLLETTVEKTTEPTLTMRGLATVGNSDNQNGMCFIIQLQDGRYIVIDGGFNRQSDADAIYSIIRKGTPTGQKPVIAAWIITHTHSDHVGTFYSKFAPGYKNAVEIQSVIYNPPAASINNTPNADTGIVEGAYYQKVVNTIAGISGCEWIRPHVGDKYYIGGAVLSFYYTVDQYYPATFNYYNTCSLVFSIEIEGQKIMINGDAANASFKKAVGMFGEELKADIVQLSHHGYTAGVSDELAVYTMQAYRLMSPSVVLWPIGSYGYENTRYKAHNQVLINLPSVKEIVVARESTHVFKLPYTANSNG